jgi:hypothetical protein
MQNIGGLILNLLIVEARKTGLPCKLSGEIDQFGSPNQDPSTLFGQQLKPTCTLEWPSGETKTIEVIIAHTQDDWKPVVTASSTLADPVAIPVTGNPESDFAAIREVVLKLFAEIN